MIGHQLTPKPPINNRAARFLFDNRNELGLIFMPHHNCPVKENGFKDLTDNVKRTMIKP